MAYNRITTMNILEVLKRHNQGQSISSIASSMGYDRKTVRKYLKAIKNNPAEDPEGIIKSLIMSEVMGRPREKQDILTPFKEEIQSLINDTSNKLKPKSAFEVISLKYDLTGRVSYSSFKRFVHKNQLIKSSLRTSTCRITTEPGSQCQIDYCKAGLIHDHATGKKKVVYAFIATLSFSRHKYVEFVYTQNEKSFIQSHIHMFRFFGGVPVTIKLDNLKSGVIKPDLYDPNLNRAYAEMAEHYGLFLDPCRVASPQDKGIVERDVQTIREEFRKMLALNPLLTLSEANEGILSWIENLYGRRKHGTTQEEPYTLFLKEEKPRLLSLPMDEYEISEWKMATVHPDHYIQVNKKAYSLPEVYIGKEVMVKIRQNTVSIYYNDELIKQHIVPYGFRQTDINDFPEHMRHRLDTGMPFYLREEAQKIAPEFEKLIVKILSPNAYINLRRAQSIVNIAKGYPGEIIKLASMTALEEYSNVHPKLFRAIIEKHQELESDKESHEMSLSLETESFVRTSDYFTH
ncbi:MAG: IS21 family transposase [Ignavibacteria bacterium]|nr:IS21 family transposase [Ignavibacteria bacterium]